MCRSRAAIHDFTAIRRDSQCQLHLGACGRFLRSRLLRLQSSSDRLYESACQIAWPFRHPRKLRCARRDRHRHERSARPGGTHCACGRNTALPPRYTGGSCGSSLFPCLRRSFVPDRPGNKPQRRDRDLNNNQSGRRKILAPALCFCLRFTRSALPRSGSAPPRS